MRHSTVLLSSSVAALLLLSACANNAPRRPSQAGSAANQRNQLSDLCYNAAARGEPTPVGCPDPQNQQTNPLPLPSTLPSPPLSMPNLGGGGGIIR